MGGVGEDKVTGKATSLLEAAVRGEEHHLVLLLPWEPEGCFQPAHRVRFIRARMLCAQVCLPWKQQVLGEEAPKWGEGQEVRRKTKPNGEGSTCTQGWPWQDNPLLTVRGREG